VTISLNFINEHRISVVADFYEGEDSDIGHWAAFIGYENEGTVFKADTAMGAVEKLCIAKGIHHD